MNVGDTCDVEPFSPGDAALALIADPRFRVIDSSPVEQPRRDAVMLGQRGDVEHLVAEDKVSRVVGEPEKTGIFSIIRVGTSSSSASR